MKAYPDDYTCDGQTSIFDFLENPEPPVLLKPGQRVYKVIKGDIQEYEVEDWTYTCGESDRGYGLIFIDPDHPDRNFHTYGRAWNSTLNIRIFQTLEEAEKKAAENLKHYDHILAADMKPKRVVAYKITRNSLTSVDFYAELDDYLIYFKYASTYDHIGTAKEIQEFERHLEKGIATNYQREELTDYTPKFKNMYRCDHDRWLYASAGYRDEF